MKKSLLALAVLGAFAASAQAQTSSVSIGGFMTVQPRVHKVSKQNHTVRGAQKLHHEVRVDDDGNSRLWFTGREDLGGGTFAQFYMESRFGGDNGSGSGTFGLAAGDTFVGIGNTKLGTVDFGRMSIGNYTQGILIELDKTGSGNNFATTTILSDVGAFGINKTRLNNFVRYRSPVFSGFQFQAGMSPNGGYGASHEGNAPLAGAAVNNSYNDGKASQLGVSYNNGPVYANLAYFRVDQEGLGAATPASMLLADNTSWRASGSYTLPFGLKIGLSVDRTKLGHLAAGTAMQGFLFPGNAVTFATAAQGGGVAAGGTVKRTAWAIPLTYTMGNHGFYARYGRANNLSNWTTGNTGARYSNIAWDYSLSKRTAVGVSYTVISNEVNGTYQQFASGPNAGAQHHGTGLYAGEKSSTVALNLKHSF